MGKLNCKCCHCGKSIYRKPSLLKRAVYCSQKCFHAVRGVLEPKQCKCGKWFKPEKKTNKFCSRKCSNEGRAGIKYSKDCHGNTSRQRLHTLKSKFDFNCCMIEGCTYNKTYDVHRHIGGIEGGEYEIGNMFAICPNHHAEITRKLIKIEKVNDWTLRVVGSEPNMAEDTTWKVAGGKTFAGS